MRLFVSGSAPLLAATHAEFEARTGQRILERYGMTETGMNASNPLDGRAAGRDGRAGAAGGRAAGLRAGRGGAGGGRGRRARGARAERLRRLLADAGEDRRGDAARRLVRHRRPGADRRRRLRDDRRAGEGPDHLRRAQRLSQGGRAGARRAAGGDRERGGRRAAPGLRRGGGGGADRARRSRRRGRRRCASGSRRSSCPSTWRWSTSCRATPWARCRRTCCASASPGCSAVDPDRPTERRWPRTPTYLAATRCGWRRVGWRRESCRRIRRIT